MKKFIFLFIFIFLSSNNVFSMNSKDFVEKCYIKEKQKSKNATTVYSETVEKITNYPQLLKIISAWLLVFENVCEDVRFFLIEKQKYEKNKYEIATHCFETVWEISNEFFNPYWEKHLYGEILKEIALTSRKHVEERIKTIQQKNKKNFSKLDIENVLDQNEIDYLMNADNILFTHKKIYTISKKHDENFIKKFNIIKKEFYDLVKNRLDMEFILQVSGSSENKTKRTGSQDKIFKIKPNSEKENQSKEYKSKENLDKEKPLLEDNINNLDDLFDEISDIKIINVNENSKSN